MNKRIVQKLVNEGKVMVISDNLSEIDCLSMLTDKSNDTSRYFATVIALPVDVFIKKLNNNMKSSIASQESVRPKRTIVSSSISNRNVR